MKLHNYNTKINIFGFLLFLDDLRAQIRIKNEEYEALIGISEHAEKLDMINTRLQDEITELTVSNLIN